MSKTIIEDDTVVSLSYTLKDGDGNVLDVATREDPLLYLHGYGNLLPPVEKALSGKTLGDTARVILSPEDGFGEYEPKHVQEVERELLPDEEIEVGMPYIVESEGSVMQFFVREVSDTHVVLDGNHPYAGKTLDFDVLVAAIRGATPEELEHGHAHGPDGHHHHH